MSKRILLRRSIILVLLLNFTLNSVSGIDLIEEGTIDENPGEIIDISFSNQYPTLGQPVIISITLKGSPIGKRFDELLNISDDFEGLIVKSNGIEWKSGFVNIDEILVKIGRLPFYIKKIRWYPVVVGNHTLRFKAGPFPEKIRNASVSFDTQNIIYPSLGCPSMISLDEIDDLHIAISEERLITEDILEIQNAELETIDGASTYILDNQSIFFSTWLQVGEDKVEDELIVSFDISAVPCDFYNLSITTSKDNYSWPHSVKIIDEEPSEYSVIQLTDTHIGKSYNLINEKNRLEYEIRVINEVVQPDFVFLSGDIIDWCRVGQVRNFWNDIQEILCLCKSPVFTTTGNHERYENGIYRLYTPFINLTYYHRYLNPLNDYAFDYGGINYVLLDSGYDYNKLEFVRNLLNPTPEASGLTNMQMYLLENEWGNSTKNQIIMMHHPAVNDVDDFGLFSVDDGLPSGNDECIAFNRAEFIEYCRENNATLVLSGHTHDNKVLDYLGEEASNPYEWPLFVQTDSATLKRVDRGGRIIQIKNGEIESYDYVPLVTNIGFYP